MNSPAQRFHIHLQDFCVLLLPAFFVTFLNMQDRTFSAATLGVELFTLTAGWLMILNQCRGRLGSGTLRLVKLGFRMLVPLSITVIGMVYYMGLLRSCPPNCRAEPDPVAACKTFASSEDTYYRMDPDHDGVFKYASSLKELYGAGEFSLVNRAFAAAEFGPNAMPKSGYYFKVLKGQGASAPGGARSYLNPRGKMTRGYALLAFPARYQPGQLSYLISSSGTIYQKDFGVFTNAQVPGISVFDPKGWEATE